MEEKRLSRTVSGSDQQLGGGVCLNLAAFVDKYSSHYLPRAVQIRKGTMRSKQVDLSEGSIFTIHAAAKSDMVSMQDTKGMVYAIPLDATSEFGLVHDRAYAGQAVEFRTAGDVAASLPTPKIVCALKNWGDDPKSAIEAGEVLIVVNASPNHLDVYSLTTLKEKRVPSKCAARFTTASTSVKLPLFKLLHYFPTIMPVKVVAFPDAYCSELPSELELCEVTLLQIHEKGSIIASYNRQQEKIVFSLPVSTPLDIYVMPFYDHKFIKPVYEYTGDEMRKKLLVSSEPKQFSTSTLLSFPQAPSQVGQAPYAGAGTPPVTTAADAATSPGYDYPRGSLSKREKSLSGTSPPPSPARTTGLNQADNEYANIDIPDSIGIADRKANIEFLSSLDDTMVREKTTPLL